MHIRNTGDQDIFGDQDIISPKLGPRPNQGQPSPYSSERSADPASPRSPANAVKIEEPFSTRRSHSLEKPDWSPLRRKVHDVLHRTEGLVGLVVLANFVFISIEVDVNAAPDKEAPDWLKPANRCFLAFYIIELSARFYVERIEFFYNSWNIFDFVIVTIGLIGEIVQGAMDSVSMLRTLRLMRMLRMIRVLESFRELWYLVRDMIACLRTLLWAFLLIFMLLTLWSITAVELLNEYAMQAEREGKYEGCDWCGEAFSSIMTANLTFFAIVSGDGWSSLARPLIQDHPWTAILFLGVIFTMSFGLLNVLIAVMCENAAMGRMADTQMMAAEKQESKNKEQAKFLRMCKTLDTDQSGTLSLEEIKQAFQDSPEFAALMQLMDITSEDIDCVFHILDEDGSGDVSYEEFAKQLWTMKTQEAKTLIMMVKYYVLQIWSKVNAHTTHLQQGYVAHTQGTEGALERLHAEMKDLFMDTKCEILTHLTGSPVHQKCVQKPNGQSILGRPGVVDHVSRSHNASEHALEPAGLKLEQLHLQQNLSNHFDSDQIKATNSMNHSNEPHVVEFESVSHTIPAPASHPQNGDANACAYFKACGVRLPN